MPRQSKPKPDKTSIASVVGRLLATPGIKDLVGQYFATPVPDRPSSRNFAGYRFDSLPDNPRHQVVASDLVAVSLLDVTFRPEAVDALLMKGEINKELLALPEKVDLWEARECIDDLYVAYGKLKKLHDVGPTKASKLLARKRPKLAPITDRHVENVFGCSGWEFIVPLADCFAERADLVRSLGDLKPAQPEDVVGPSTLRLLDVAIWMTQSRAESAQDARELALGCRDAVKFREG